MSDVGTITEIEPEDQLGWIELEDSTRVRFGGTACQGFVPEVGMRVRILGTRPGYGGTVKATGLEKVQAAPPKPLPSSSSGASAGAEPPRAPRTSLHRVQSAGVRADDFLLALLGRADVDDAFHRSLERLSFELKPGAASALGYHNPWMYVVAIEGSSSAYGLYQHPLVAHFPDAPWVRWHRATGALRYLAADTATFMKRLLAGASSGPVDDQARITLTQLGMPGGAAAPLDDGEKMPWLPPDDDELRPLADYLAETDGAQMERGLLAHVARDESPEAQRALERLYQAWGWETPGS